MIPPYIAHLWSAFSQFLNVLLLNGHPNESISGRCYGEPWPRTMKIVNWLFFWQQNHCKSAYLNDVKWAKSYLAETERKGLE
jgi:hypothetical protein